MQEVWLVAAENGALPGGKVGGIGDVIRDLPAGLAARGLRPVVITPGYGHLSRLPGATLVRRVAMPFAGRRRVVRIFEVPGPNPAVRHLVCEHPLMQPGQPGEIYIDSAPDRPFADDATKFALFCQTVAYLLLRVPALPAVVHLHDWHAGLLLALRELNPKLARLRELRMVFTVHNLALQGIRPAAGDESSFAAWFPELDATADCLADPRYDGCVNPVAAALRLADCINTVSPTYAREITRPSEPERGFVGGEGLEELLRAASARERLFGILNGCEYPATPAPRSDWPGFVAAARRQLVAWQEAGRHSPAHALAAERLGTLADGRPPHWLLGIGRLTAQKVALYLETVDEQVALERIMRRLGETGVLVLIGSGDAALETRFTALMDRHPNFLFLNGFAGELADLGYRGADLFLMPSSFEPCGIGQLLAMREGQPCVAHAVGGLKDTVHDGKTGFTFGGEMPPEQARNFVATVDRALRLRESDAACWQRLCAAARAARFAWPASVDRYIGDVYGL